MELDPHTLHQILDKIHNQMRCPQCGNKVPVDLSNVQVMADTGLLMHLFCDRCNAHIVLQASLSGIENISAPPYEDDTTRNASSTLTDDHKTDVNQIRDMLAQGVSFEDMFKVDVVDGDAKPETE